jgi:hypothetical protein
MLSLESYITGQHAQLQERPWVRERGVWGALLSEANHQILVDERQSNECTARESRVVSRAGRKSQDSQPNSSTAQSRLTPCTLNSVRSLIPMVPFIGSS